MSFILSEYMKSFFFVFVVHYFIMLLPVVFFVRLRWVFIKSVFVVGSEAVAICDIIIFKKSWCIIRLYVVFVLRAFLIERLCGLFVVVVFVIDFTIDWWDSFSCLLCFVFCWTVVILWERRKIKVWRCIATLLLLNPVSKWVRSDPCGWTFDFGGYCLLWKRFLVLNVVLRAAQVKSFAK